MFETETGRGIISESWLEMFVSILKHKQIYKLEYEYYPVYLEYIYI